MIKTKQRQANARKKKNTDRIINIVSENTIKTTQKHGNVCKNENKSLRTYQCIINTMSENTIKTIQIETRIYADVYRHTHQRKPQCAFNA